MALIFQTSDLHSYLMSLKMQQFLLIYFPRHSWLFRQLLKGQASTQKKSQKKQTHICCLIPLTYNNPYYKSKLDFPFQRVFVLVWNKLNVNQLLLFYRKLAQAQVVFDLTERLFHIQRREISLKYDPQFEPQLNEQVQSRTYLKRNHKQLQGVSKLNPTVFLTFPTISFQSLQFIIIYKYQKFCMDQKISSDEIGEDAYPSVSMGSLKESSQLVNTDEQTVVKKLSNYANADFEERYYIVKNLSILISQIGQNSLLYIKPLLEKIIKDDKEITQLLLKQLPQLQKTISHLKQFEVLIKDSFIPTLLEYLNSNQLEIKEEAAKYLGKLTSELSDMDRGNLVLKHVIEMAHDDQNQNNRIVATQLFSSMGQCFGSQLCEQFIGFQILSLGEDISPKVKREAILNLPKIASLVSHQFFTLKFFPFYLSKCKDPNNWGLRKACVETIVEISKLSEPHSRVTDLTQVMLFFLKDSNKWVKITAYKNLGQFINTLKGMEVNKKLIVEFTKMTEKEVNSLQKQNQIIYACAFNFPAVVDVLGPQKWESDLWKTYQKLLNSSDKNIKKTLSQSLHVIAKILGQQLTEKYLFPVADKYIKDKTNQIKLGMIRNISGLLSTLSMKRRIQLIDVFQQFQKDQKKWRIRLCIAKQLNEIGNLYDENTTFVYVVPTLFRFCSDPVYIIREQAANKVANFLENFKNQQIYQIGMIQNIKGFGISPKYTQRQTFLIMCKKLMQNPQLFHKHFMSILQALVNDKVLNVKLVLAEVLKEHLEHKGALSADEKLISLVQKLKQDEDEEIKNVFKQ